MKNAKQKILRAAQKKAGMIGFGKSDVIRYVCEQTNSPMPPSWQLRYELLKKWAGIAPKPPKVKPAKGPDTSVPHVPAIRGEKRLKQKTLNKMATDAFLLSTEWRQLRMRVLVKRGARCECCGATPQDGVRMNIDHVKPRKKYPELALDEANLQVLCEVCNHGKGNWDETDWRPKLVQRA